MHQSTRPLRGLSRSLSIGLAAVLTLALLSPTAQASEETPASPTTQASDAASNAADWIADELTQPQPSFDEFGKTAARTDVIYALASAGGHEGAVRTAVADLRAGATDYIGPKGAVNTGALAKVLLSVAIVNEDPVAFVPGRDLEAELRAAIGADGMFAADVFNHSLAMIALATTDAGVPQAATDALEKRQCEGGDFTFMGTCPSVGADVDTTAVAVQALSAAGRPGSMGAGADFLVDVQNADGSFPNPFGDPNTNSAGVAALALRSSEESVAADLAAGFVESLQLADGGIRFVASDTEANGFATLQGILAFDAAPLHTLIVQPYADVLWDDLFGTEIDWLGDRGITRGCNPPTNDRFCPNDNVTRGQMAAFLVRALGLDDTGTDDFIDDDDSEFQADIARLAAAGITKGCNPPTNDRYCPDDNVTRGQMAAFLHRALGDSTESGRAPDFVDDDNSVFEADIEWLAAAGITKGCNPPTNDQFCPNDNVTRGQMAAFLYRALKG